LGGSAASVKSPGRRLGQQIGAGELGRRLPAGAARHLLRRRRVRWQIGEIHRDRDDRSAPRRHRHTLGAFPTLQPAKIIPSASTAAPTRNPSASASVVTFHQWLCR